MNNFTSYQSLRDFQKLMGSIYALPDDRLFSLQDLISNQERFTMRALKGIRKNSRARLTKNLLISFSWCMAVSNRLHIDIEDAVWYRFPMLCSYCGHKPCVCKKEKVIERVKILRRSSDRPNRLADFQVMFDKIYPNDERILADAGVHLAEEVGEVSEAAHVYLGEHKAHQFEALRDEIADWVSCMFGVANSANINVATELEKMFIEGCHVCHNSPCTCSFSFIAKLK